MSWHPREVAIGGITGMVGTILGVASVVGLRSDLGWASGLMVGGAVGGLGSWLAAKRVLREATACLAALGNDSDGPERGGHGSDGGESLPVLGSEAFDAWIAHLHRVLEHFRQIRSEHAGALRLARQLQAAMIGPEGANGSSARSDPDREGTVQSLRILLDQFRQAVVPINRDLSALQEANERVASGAQDQSEAVSRTATSVEALSDRIDRIAQHASEAADACERARHEAHQGLDQVHSVIDGVDRLLTRTEANGRKVRRLEDRSTEIGAIVDLIRGISSRTDMLALNATIESIRAGEHGRGFAVIAEEIRKLAERTAGATREISTLVEAIQSDAQESIQALGEEQVQMQGESQRLRETGCSLERISQVAERSARLVEGISRSTRDQVLTTQELVPHHAANLRGDPSDRGANHPGPRVHPGLEAIMRALATTGRRRSDSGLDRPADGRGSPSDRRIATVLDPRARTRSGRWIGAVRPRIRLRPARPSAPRNGERAIAMRSPSQPLSTASSLADRLHVLADVWQNVTTDVAGRPIPISELDTLRDRLNELTEEAEAGGQEGLAAALRRIALLSEVWECLESEPDPPEAADDVAEFCLDAMQRLAGYSWACADSGDDGVVEGILRRSDERWGNYLSPLDPTNAGPSRR